MKEIMATQSRDYIVANVGGYSNLASVLGTPGTERVYKPLKASNV